MIAKFGDEERFPKNLPGFLAIISLKKGFCLIRLERLPKRIGFEKRNYCSSAELGGKVEIFESEKGSGSIKARNVILVIDGGGRFNGEERMID